MIWVLLALLGVPLWLIAAGIVVLVVRARRLHDRTGNVAIRLHRSGKDPAKGWNRGNAVWVRDVLAFRGWPAAWSEALVGVSSATTRPPSEEERHPLRRLDKPVIAVLDTGSGDLIEVAAAGDEVELLLGPFADGLDASDWRGRAPTFRGDPVQH